MASLGSGDVLVRTATWLNHLEFEWPSPVRLPLPRFLSERFQLVRYDGRGNVSRTGTFPTSRLMDSKGPTGGGRVTRTAPLRVDGRFARRSDRDRSCGAISRTCVKAGAVWRLCERAQQALRRTRTGDRTNSSLDYASRMG